MVVPILQFYLGNGQGRPEASPAISGILGGFNMPADLVMKKYRSGQLHSGSKSGPVVKNRKQAIAILLSEKRAEDDNGGTYPERGKKPTRSKRG